MKRSDIPNIISIARILLVVPLVILFLREQYLLVLLVFAVAGLSDALDGYLARRYQWTSPLGAALDPIGDKVLLSTCFICLALVDLMPLWLAVLVLARDVIIIGGACAYYMLIGRYQMEPTMMSKLNTVLQVGLPLLILVDVSLVGIHPWVITFGIYAVLITTMISGGHYVWLWGRKAWRAAKSR